MESYLSKSKSAIQILAAFVVLLCALFFANPANAATRDITAPVNAKPVQLAYYYYYPHRHHWRWHRWHRGHRWHHWHHWRCW